MMGSSHHVGHCVCNPYCARVTVAAKDERITELEYLLEQRAQSHAVSQNMVSKDQATISALAQKIEKAREALKKYGWHRDCKILKSLLKGEEICDCGLRAIIAELQ